MKENNIKIEEIFETAFQFQKKNDLENAEKYYNETLKINTNHFKANFFLGTIFLEKKQFDKARELFLKAISINPKNPDSYSNLGIAMKELGQQSKSIICFQKAIEIEPNHKMAYNNLGIALKESGQYEDAIKSYQKAIQIDSNNADALNNLGVIFTELGDHGKSATYFQNAIDIQPKHGKAYPNLLFSLCWLNNSENYLKLAKKYSDTIPKYEENNSFHFNSANEKFLKVGFVSGDFKNHPVGFFLLDTLKNLKKKNLKLFAYNNNQNEDELTLSLKKYFDNWISIVQENDEDIIKLIRKDNIDILFDLSGHTKDNKLTIFKNRCAPVQVTWIGWLASTGIKEIDYIVGDSHVTPTSDQPKFVEKIYQLKKIWECLSISNLDSKILSIKKNDENSIIFGAFNNTIKLNESVIKTWSQILKKIPNSKLLLKYSSFDIPEIRKIFVEKFTSNGVNANQILIEGRSTRIENIECYNKVDIALDSFPVTGGTTGFEASYMGVPILTQVNENNSWFRSGVSINKNLNMDEWIAKNEEDYVAKALKFSENKNYLINLKKELRNVAFESSLFDSTSFSNDFYEMLLDISKK